MNLEDEKAALATLENLAAMKLEAERLAEQFRIHREDLRAEAIHAVTVNGISVLRAATAAGIDRRTLTVWLQVHNAEQKALKKA